MLSLHLNAMRNAARLLHDCGLGPVHRTCLSLRDGSALWLSRDDASLLGLGWGDLVQSSLFRRAGPEDALCCRAGLHRAVYLGTHHAALLESTPPALLSLAVGQSEWLGLFEGTRLPLLPAQASDGPALGERLSRTLKLHPVAVVNGLAVFAAGQDLEDLASRICELETRARALLAPRPPTCG